MVFGRRVPVEDPAEYVKDALDGKVEAQQKLIRHFAGFIAFCTGKFYLSEEDRRDLAQEGRIALFHAIRRYNSARGFFAPYARLVIRRRINRAAEKFIHVQSTEYTRGIDELQDLKSLSETRTPECEAEEGERRRELTTRVGENLTPLEARVLSLYLTGMSYRQMSRQLRKPAKSVDNALRRIRAKVKV